MVVSPIQIIKSPSITGLGNGLTVTVMPLLATHPLASVTVTEYIVLTAGLTTILLPVVALFQIYDTPPVATRVVDSPKQIILSPLTEGIGNGLTVTDMPVLAAHPLVSVTVTV